MKIIEVKNNNSEIVEEAVKVLNKGGLIIYPTETCYGVGVKAIEHSAVKRLLRYKKRPSGKAISIAVSDIKMAQKYVKLNKTAESIYKKLLPGPVTVVSNSKRLVSKELESEFKTLGVRIPDYPLILKIITELGSPITATSANSSGKKTPYSIKDVFETLSHKQKELIDLVIDAGVLPHKPPSTVIDTTRLGMQVLRKGSVNIENNSKSINSEDEMRNLGQEFIKKYIEELKNKCLIILLNAELGSGKTQFVKGIARSLGIKEIVKSPTYSIVEEYDLKKGLLVHIDTWRLGNISEFKYLSIEEKIKKGNVIAVEWSAGVEEYFEKFSKNKGVELIKIDITYDGIDKRKVMIWD